ncbi:MAG: phosphatase PAP2 family protein [Bacteroidota bacterium]|nr:phosphatase PAP2 family protein [Bacteroidota bacterium]
MLEHILEFDFKLFQLINIYWTNSVFDSVLPFLRNKYFWTPFYIFLFSYFIINFKKKGLLLILIIILLIFVSDQLSSHVIKPFVGRLRPCNEILIKDYVRLLANCSSGFSFPSSHATNHFALAFFLIVLFNKRYKWVFPVLFFWAFAISYSQVYVGVHYPLDILTGGFLGTIIGITFGMIPKNHLNLEI